MIVHRWIGDALAFQASSAIGSRALVARKAKLFFKSLKRVPFTAIQQEVAHRRNAQVDPAMKVIRAQSVTKKNARGKTL
jgi:hypothetical protein